MASLQLLFRMKQSRQKAGSKLNASVSTIGLRVAIMGITEFTKCMGYPIVIMV